MPRPLALVTDHTYHITCRDTNGNQGGFDATQEAWRHNGTTVRHLTRDNFPGTGGTETYASRELSSEPNEWTLVLQRFGGVAVGVYSCHAPQGQVLALDIGESKLHANPKEGGRGEGGKVVAFMFDNRDVTML